MAQWWAEFNDDFRAHEIPYFQTAIEEYGQPALDVACGAGRLLLPYRRAGLDVDGCDVSADMVAACRRKAEAEGLEPTLYVQPMHELDIPRTYRTIFVCGSFGVGSNRERDAQALERFRAHLEPGGTLVIDAAMPYNAEPRGWSFWLSEPRASLPQESYPPPERRATSDGAELAMSTRLVDLDPLEQQVTMAVKVERWRDGEPEAEEERHLHMGMYFKSELLLMLEHAGFTDVVVHGEHERRPARVDDAFIVLVARA